MRFSVPALRHVLDVFARTRGWEPCGLLLGRCERRATRVQVVEAVVVQNAHTKPRECWSMTPEAQLEASCRGRAQGLDVVGTWHGHRVSAPTPGRADLKGHAEFERAASRPQVCVIVGRGSGPFAVVRAWTRAANEMREVPIRN